MSWQALFLLILGVSYGEETQKQEIQSRQLLHYPPPAGILLNHQSTIYPYNVPRSAYPQLDHQILIYQGGVPGQSFLLQPGAPPGNFLIPQPQPGFVLRDVPQRPYYPGVQPAGQPAGRPGQPAGQPKPAFVPPINKDAEEIPTNPAAIPPFRSQDIKPEKLETFDEKPEYPDPAVVERNPTYPKNAIPLPNLRPGQRFFILNGQPLFSNYPIHPSFINQASYQPDNNRLYYYQQEPAEFSKVHPLEQQQVSVEDYFLRNAVTGEINNVRPNYIQQDVAIPQNFISLNHPVDYKQNSLFRYTLPLPVTLANKEIGVKSNNNPAEKSNLKNNQKLPELNPIIVTDDETRTLQDNSNLDYFRYQSEKIEDDNDAVVIDAKVEQDKDDNDDTEVVTAQKDDRKEPSMAQAQPGAIALAGPGGVASAGPRGTALAGDGGLAVSSPKATAVAGPRDEDKKSKDNKKPK